MVFFGLIEFKTQAKMVLLQCRKSMEFVLSGRSNYQGIQQDCEFVKFKIAHSLLRFLHLLLDCLLFMAKLFFHF
jgi:hypothetical protein